MVDVTWQKGIYLIPVRVNNKSILSFSFWYERYSLNTIFYLSDPYAHNDLISGWFSLRCINIEDTKKLNIHAFRVDQGSCLGLTRELRSLQSPGAISPQGGLLQGGHPHHP